MLKTRMKKKDQMRNLVCYCVVLQHSTSSSLILHPESLYNDGKGIQVSVLLIGLLPRPKTGEKRRVNAKPPVTTKVVYIHEKTTFVNGLTQIIIHTFKRRDLCRGGLDSDGNLKKKTSDLFSLAYTIPRTQLKDVEILSEYDWGTFLEEAGKKPSAQGKLTITEKLVSLVSSLIPDYLLGQPPHYIRQLRLRPQLRLRWKSQVKKKMRTTRRRRKRR
jgi:hypothetical protein